MNAKGITAQSIEERREKFYTYLPASRYLNSPNKMEIPQMTFLSELDISGHKINDPYYYEDIEKEVPIEIDGETKTRTVTVAIARVAVPIQEVILEKQITHLCGSNLHFTLNRSTPSDEERADFVEVKQGWLDKNMETAKSDFCRSVKATGDGAFCGVLTNGKFSYRVFSISKGDKLHPIRDFNGKLRIFGRSFSAFNFEAGEDLPYLEVWDDKYYTRFKYSENGDVGKTIKWDTINFTPYIAEKDLDSDGWVIDQAPVHHGFSSIPVDYLKNKKGACWTPVQDLIDKLELALSQLFENNKSYAFSILKIKGGFEIQGSLKSAEARAILFEDNDGDADFINKADHSPSFELQLKQTLDFIKLGAFIVIPPEVRGGDLPGVTIKIMYSPAIEKGINDKNFYNESIDKMVNIFIEGYGIEKEKRLTYKNLNVRGDIQIYIHQNDAETTNNIVMQTQAGILSKESAREHSTYSNPDEETRVHKDKLDDLEYERMGIVGRQPNDGMNETNLTRQIIAETT